MGARLVMRVIGAALATALGVSVLAAPSQASVPAASSKPVGGSVDLVFSPTFVAQLFKAGVFMYGASSVQVSQGDSQALSASFPLQGTSTAKGTRRIDVDGETGGISWYNGPAEATAGMGVAVVRRTGDTGTVRASLIGPYSVETGEQFDTSVVAFTLSRVRTKTTTTGWSMTGRLVMTPQAADIMNELLTTDVFKPGVRIGSLSADVTLP
jgi:hypothetical protein